MHNRFLLLGAGLLAAVALFPSAEKVVIRKADIVENENFRLRESQAPFPDSLVFDADVEEIRFPALATIPRLGKYGFRKLKRVVFDDIDYVPSVVVDGMPGVEELVFNGMVGHFDCMLLRNCPDLKRVVFNEPVSSTGGPGFASGCPKLGSVVFNNVVGTSGLDISPDPSMPLFRRFDGNGAYLAACNDSLTPPAHLSDFENNPRLRKGLERLASWQSEVLRSGNPDIDFFKYVEYQSAKHVLQMLDSLGSAKAHVLREAMEHAWNSTDAVKTYLEILKESPAYARDPARNETFSYALPSDSALAAARGHFNLDSIAGNGDDISRIKNLLYWVHNNIAHDGSNGFPKGPRTLRNIYDSSHANKCGYNCRALAISLTEALLAENIPARYITCQSKKWDTDSDAHVICVAWSSSLGKWIWVDPTFAAYVTDENGLLLHPGEVRQRLIGGLPLVLNEDANWNNRVKETAEEYLENYMAKNLYLLEANMINCADPEGDTKGKFAALVPQGSNYTNAHIITTDDEWFWQPPVK